VGSTGEVAAGLLHSAKLLCSKMSAEAAATSALLAAVETGDDPAALNHALHAAAALELKGSPAVAAAQTVLLELTAVHRLRMASSHADPVKLVEAVAEAKALTASAAAQPAKKSSSADVDRSIDDELANAPPSVDPEHYRLNSVATAVFATVNGGRTRKSLAMLEQNMVRLKCVHWVCWLCFLGMHLLLRATSKCMCVVRILREDYAQEFLLLTTTCYRRRRKRKSLHELRPKNNGARTKRSSL